VYSVVLVWFYWLCLPFWAWIEGERNGRVKNILVIVGGADLGTCAVDLEKYLYMGWEEGFVIFLFLCVTGLEHRGIDFDRASLLTGGLSNGFLTDLLEVRRDFTLDVCDEL